MRVQGKFNSQTGKRRLTCRRSAVPWVCSRTWINSCSIGDASDIDRCASNVSAVDCSAVKPSSINCSFGKARNVAIIKAVKLPLLCWCVLRLYFAGLKRSKEKRNYCPQSGGSHISSPSRS